ncbi:tRNA pseudouridine(13) synthase TruD [Salinigranum rubrum]|uniref:Probable tRNA pseudouridine synthase D n=1 Tax=Salinigranum rubrum TaxID=755307 RepID=A0A2I8VG74_9EURY|nr:tRNA pseudouridine(13) synthase TruD [Salinigranum rubrum]AUV80922.1 tRNA pseudouridine(13) synthase TruD [Salinigranum rubrum]
MREAHPRERTVGMEWYASDADGVGGRLRTHPEDFRVREVETVEAAPVDGDPGDYAHLLVRATLRGWDTNDFAARLSDALGMSRERVSWAGTKDKHAVTTQLFSLQGVSAQQVPDVNDAEVEVVGRLGRALQFGDLAGNDFSVRVRDLACDTEVARERVSAVTDALAEFGGDGTDGESERAVGVPNYFGHQRFGSRRPVTHTVGLHVVRGEWREAVLAYCGSPAETEPEETQEARAVVDGEAASDDPDWQRALDAIPGYLRYERSMLHRLAEGTEEGEREADRFRRALEAVPSNLQRLFVNAAQSYAFNRIVSERLRRGVPLARPVEGDVVCFADRSLDEAFGVPDTSREQRVTERRVGVMEKHCARGRAFVTAPLVGTETDLGEGEPGEIEREVLDDLDLAPEDFSLPGAFDSTGTRRAVLVRTRLDAEVDEDGATFDFALPRGSYATVLLREFLKSDPLEL